MSDNITIITEHPIESGSLSTIRSILSMSEYLQNAIIDNEVTIPSEALIRISTLKLVVEFCEYRLSHPDMKDDMDKFMLDKEAPLSQWDDDFLSSFSIPTLFRVTRASEFLHIENLITLCILRFKQIVKENTLEQLKVMLRFPEGISVEDMTP